MTDWGESSVIDGSYNDNPEATSTYVANVFAASMGFPSMFRPPRFSRQHQRLLFWSARAQLQNRLPTKVAVLISFFWVILQLPVNCCWSFNQGDGVIEAVPAAGGEEQEYALSRSPLRHRVRTTLKRRGKKQHEGPQLGNEVGAELWLIGVSTRLHSHYRPVSIHSFILSSLSLWQQLLYPRRDAWEGSRESETYRQGHQQRIRAPLPRLVLFISTYPSLHPVKFGWPAGELQPCWTRGHGKRLYVERVKHRRIKTELEISVRVNKFFRHEVRKQFQIFTPGKIHVFEKHRSFCLFQV